MTLILRHASKDWFFPPGCELFISLYPNSCNWQAPEHVLQMCLSISLESVKMCKWLYWVCTDGVWSVRCDQKRRQGCLYAPLTLTWHKPLAHVGPYSALSVVHLLAEPPPPRSSLVLCTQSQPELQLPPQQFADLAGNGKQMMKSYVRLRNSALSALFFWWKDPFGHHL